MPKGPAAFDSASRRTPVQKVAALAREQADVQVAVRQPGHTGGHNVQGAAPIKRRPVMGPALLPAGTTLSMVRWSLSFTARIREGGLSWRSQRGFITMAASCLK